MNESNNSWNEVKLSSMCAFNNMRKFDEKEIPSNKPFWSFLLKHLYTLILI